MFEIQECLKSVQTMFETTKIGIKVPRVPEVVSYLILIVRVECFIKLCTLTHVNLNHVNKIEAREKVLSLNEKLS